MDEIMQRMLRVIEEHRREIIAFGRDIYDHAELGYKEHRTSARFAAEMERLGLPVRRDLAITGAKAYLNPEKAGTASLALLGELDALRIPAHAHADPETGAAHCCGHHAQMAGLLGAAIALSDKEVVAALDGQVIFFAVPAEEYGEVDFKKQLMQEGKIAYGGGKCELLRTGAFEEVDLAVTHHITTDPGIHLGSGSGNGFVSKVITLHGRAAHAAAGPEKGVNALSAASLGLQALGLNRETFRDEDCVRVHPILTRGGDLVNVVPETAVVETLVRGKTLAAIEDASRKTDRSFRAGALALGAGITIETMPGYLPSLPQETPEPILEMMEGVFPQEKLHITDPGTHGGGSTDVGDVQHLMPVLTFHTGGASGGLHSSAFDITDEENAYLDTARVFALYAYALLKDRAALAREVKAGYRPRFAAKEEYTAYLEQFRGCWEEENP
ncbi:MAG: amidohydrolase [Oscillibacter sp.]|nr:amidohydrolase [Oscillibacter sp.]